MKKISLTLVGILLSIGLFTSCRETKTEVKEVRVETETKKDKSALERAAEKVDEEVDEEVDKAIDKIDD